jgi:hypothetical protein
MRKELEEHSKRNEIKGGELKAKRSAANQSWRSDRVKQEGEAQEE